MGGSVRRAGLPFPPVKETEIVGGILGFLEAMGFMAWRQNTGAAHLQAANGRTQFVRFGFAGLSDILGILPDGRFLAIEVKKPGGAVRPAQRDFIAAATKRRALAFIAYSLDDVHDRLKKEGYIK